MLWRNVRRGGIIAREFHGTAGMLPVQDEAHSQLERLPGTVAGVDGCRGGWVAVWITAEEARDYRIVHRFEEIASLGPSSVMVDIPIGLPETGYRACDLEARKFLGAGRSRVFLGVRRQLLEFLDDYGSANKWAKANGKGISRQLFGVMAKVAEVDRFIAGDRQLTVRETHPELVFFRLNGERPLPSKKSREGRTERRALLEAQGFTELDEWQSHLFGTRAKVDDLLDACACALVAKDAVDGIVHKIKCASEIDCRGLPMEMWF